MIAKAKRITALTAAVAVMAVLPAAPAVAGGGGGGGDKNKTGGPNQCRNQKGVQVNVVSCNNIGSIDIL